MTEQTIRPVPRVLCSSGALARGPNPVDAGRVEQYGPQLRADGLEIMIYGAWYGRLDEVAERFRALDTPMPVTHGEKSIGPDLVANGRANRDRALARFAANCRFTRAIGADTCVLHLWGLPDADTLVERQLEDLPLLLDISDQHGVILAVEAIPCTVSTPLDVVHRVLETDSRARVAIDTEFLGMHDQLETVFDPETDVWLWAPGNVAHVHIKDFNGPIIDDSGRRRYLHPGEGSIDFPAWFARLAERGYAGSISLETPVCRPDGTLDSDRAERSLTMLRKNVTTAWAQR